MAEALAVVGAVASVVQLLDFSIKVVNRLTNFLNTIGEVPEPFRDITLQLPLLIHTLQRTKYHLDYGHYSPQTKVMLQALIDGCHKQIASLEDIVDRGSPKQQDSKMTRSRKAIYSTSHERDVVKITMRLSGYIEKLILFQSAIAPDYIIGSIKAMLSIPPQACRPYQAIVKATTTDTVRVGYEDSYGKMRGTITGSKKGRASYDNRKRRRFSTFVSLVPLSILWNIQASLELSWGSKGYTIAPTLQLQKLVKYTSPGFEILWKYEMGYIDLSIAQVELNRVFQAEKASVFDMDPEGNNWLEKLFKDPFRANLERKLAFFKMLVQNGMQLNINTPLLSFFTRWNENRGSHIILLKELLAMGYDISEESFIPRNCHLIEPWASSWCIFPALQDSLPDPFLILFLQECSRNTFGFWGQTQLMDNVLCGSTSEIISCLRYSKSLNEKNDLGQSALHLAVFRSAELSRLIEAGAEVDIQDNEGRSPLEYAAIYGYAETVVILLEAGANPISEDEGGAQHIVFLDHARVWNHWEVIIRAFSFFRSAPCYSEKFLYSELNHLMTTNFRNFWHLGSQNMRYLFKLGADPNLLLPDENTLLHYAKDSEEFSILFEAGFKLVNHFNSSGLSPLMSVSHQKFPGLYKAILTKANINQQNQNGNSAIHIVCLHMGTRPLSSDKSRILKEISEDITKAEVLLRHGADPLIRDNCRCPCSVNGCSATTLLLLPGNSTSQTQGDLIAMEWLLMLRVYGGFSVTRQAFLDLVRVKQFNKLGMTHLCCMRKTSLHPRSQMDEEEVDEILDEERYLLQELEDFMKYFSDRHDNLIEQGWLKALAEYSVPEKEQPEKRWSWSIWNSKGDMTLASSSPEPPRWYSSFAVEEGGSLKVSKACKSTCHNYYVHESSDSFRTVSGPKYVSRIPASQLYGIWVDYYFETHKIYSSPKTIDLEWYKGRKYWATRQAEILEAVCQNETVEKVAIDK